MRVLIVDDDRIIREDVRRLIDWESNGYKLVADASNGKEALDIVQSTQVDIILTDIYMPVMNGIELIKSVKTDHNEIQIVVMSNYDDFSYVKDAMKYGALDYILKYQMNSSSLLSVLNNAAIEVEKVRREFNEKSHLMQVAYKEKKQNQKHFWKEFINGCYDSESAMRKTDELSIEFPKWDFMTVLVKFEHPIEQNKINLKNIFHDVTYYQIELDEELVFLVHIDQKSYLFVQSKINEIVKKLSVCL